MAVIRGRFITLEGGEGAGKSTQSGLLADWLAEQGVEAVQTREPGGSPRAEALRELLLSGVVAPFGPQAEALLFAVARADHMNETIRPALQGGAWVICDRFIDSTRAYQGASGVEPQELNRLENLAVGADRPDLTVILDLPAVVGLYRAKSRSGPVDRFEADDIAVQEDRRKIFLDIAQVEAERCVVIDGSETPEQVAKAIQDAVRARLGDYLSDAG
jgi:dTMP kinase